MSVPPSPPPAAPDGGGEGAGRHTPSSAPTCPRHRDRVSYIRCQRCDRPVCPDCQRPAAVGVQCVDCVKEGAKTVPTPRTRFGAPARAGGTPYVTWGLLGLCVAVFAGQLLSPGLTGRLSFIGVLAGVEPWRFLTTAFVHSPSSFLHIVFNMYILYTYGPALEQLLGRGKYLLIYLTCALGGSVGVLLFSSVDPGWFTHVVGASGAIFGLLLLYVVVSLRTGRIPGNLLLIIGISLVMPFFAGNIAWEAHIGGALTGAAIGGLLLLTSAPGRSAEAARRRRLIWPALVGLILVLAALAVWRLVQVLGPSAFSMLSG